ALRAAPYDPAVLDTCYRAIITQKQLGFDYLRADGSERRYTVDVFGVAILLPKIYIVARKTGGEHLQTFLLHKIRHAWLENRPAHVPEDFSLHKWLADGHMEMYVDPSDRALHDLHLVFESPRPGLIEDLRESPIAEDQTLECDTDGRWHLSARVRRTVQLRHWLMSVADVAYIDAPDIIRNDVMSWAERLLNRQKGC
ncbi:MAG: WYL domain-containing protein, partial [Gammaproteobacteria bacterium]